MANLVITGNSEFNKTFKSLVNHNTRYQVLDTELGSVNVFTLLLNKIVAVCKCILFDKSPYDKSVVRDNLNGFFGQNIDRLKLQDTETLLKVKKTLVSLQKSFAKGKETVDAAHEQVQRPLGQESLYEAIDAIDQAIASKSDVASQTSIGSDGEYAELDGEVEPDVRRETIRQTVGDNPYLIDLYMEFPEQFKAKYRIEL